MSFTINTSPLDRYESYLSSSLKPHPSNFDVRGNRFIVLASFVNQMASMIIHHFIVQPDHLCFCQKNKIEPFSSIATRKQYKFAKKIFKNFGQCSDEKAEELNRMGGQLVSLKKALQKRQPLCKLGQIEATFRRETALLGRQYRKVLGQFFHFKHHLLAKSQKRDRVFDEYFQKVKNIFGKAWLHVHANRENLEAQFQGIFPEFQTQLQKNGEVACSLKQLEWVISTILHQFPGIYQLVSEISTVEIQQSIQLASWGEFVLVGKKNRARSHPSSPFFIYDTIGKHSLRDKVDVFRDPRFKKNSFFYTYFDPINEPLEESKNEIKSRLSFLASGYVNNWLIASGITLDFGNHLSRSGVQSSDWIKQARDDYTQVLLEMDSTTLKKEIQSAFNCPFVHLITKAFAREIKNDEWTSSLFPESLIKKFFCSELSLLPTYSTLSQSICQTYEDAQFVNPLHIITLAQIAECAENRIEALIRIRIFYVVCCLGDDFCRSLLENKPKSIVGMFGSGPSLSGESILICNSNESYVLKFNKTLDRVKIIVNTSFQDKGQFRDFAKGLIKVDLDSLDHFHKSETTYVDLKDFHFSLYISKPQLDFLMTQASPAVLVSNMKQLAVDVRSLNLCQKADSCKVAYEEYLNKSGWQKLWKIPPFNLCGYQDLETDIKFLDPVIACVKTLVRYINIKQTLCFYDQMTNEQHDEFQDHELGIKRNVQQLLNFLKTVYLKQEREESILLHKIDELQELMDVTASDACVTDSASENDGFVNLSLPPVGKEPFIGNTRVIGSADRVPKSWVGFIWDYTVGYFTKEATEAKFFKWKIERYEDLIVGFQKGVLAYLKQMKMPAPQELILQAESSECPEWQKQILPIFKGCVKIVRRDEERFNQLYLCDLRKTYTLELLAQLRSSAEWAKNNPLMPGTDHVNAICSQFYTFLDLNQRCQQIFETFIELGRDTLAESRLKEPLRLELLLDPRFAIVKDLLEAYAQIKAVGNSAKAPLIKQLANSARGQLGGVWGVTAFDPTMQSNPIHRRYTLTVTKENSGGSPISYQVIELGAGSPTIENGNGSVKITPEFEAFLRDCQRKNETHYYNNQQNMIPQAWLFGDESARCRALHQCAETNFKNTLFVVTWSQNSHFYHHKGYEIRGKNVNTIKGFIVKELLNGKSTEMRKYIPAHLISQWGLRDWIAKSLDQIHREVYNERSQFANDDQKESFIHQFQMQLNDYLERQHQLFPPKKDEKGCGYSIYDPSAVRFKTELLVQVFDLLPSESGNCIPKDLVERFDLRNWGKAAADHIHEKLFKNRAQLSFKERRIFIRIFYLYNSRNILFETKAKTHNKSCKDGIDRAAASNAEDLIEYLIRENYIMDPQAIAYLKSFLFVRAIIVRKRAIIEERLMRLIETVLFMIEHPEELQELHAVLFPNIKISNDLFPKKKG